MNVAFASVKANLRFVINENSINDQGAIEVYVDRNYGRVQIEELECFSLDIHSEEYRYTERHFSSWKIWKSWNQKEGIIKTGVLKSQRTRYESI